MRISPIVCLFPVIIIIIGLAIFGAIRFSSLSPEEKKQLIERFDWRTVVSYGLGGIGVLILFVGLQSLLGDSDARGLYCTMPIGGVIILAAWLIRRGI